MEFRMFASLPASDIERARSWYEKMLGASPTDVDADDGALIYRQGDNGFLVYPSAFAGTNEATAAGIAVEDFDGALAELRSNGAVFEEYDFGDGWKTVDGVMTGSSGRRVAWLKDPEGNILSVTENP